MSTFLKYSHSVEASCGWRYVEVRGREKVEEGKGKSGSGGRRVEEKNKAVPSIIKKICMSLPNTTTATTSVLGHRPVYKPPVPTPPRWPELAPGLWGH